MNEQLERIKSKIGQLEKLDKDYSLFGSQKHKYTLNPVISFEKVRQFESTQKIKLPNDYVDFLTKIGNGGAGPFYGLEPLENSLFDDLDFRRPDTLLNPAKPFLHTESWNLNFKATVSEEQNEEEYEKQLSEFEEKYYDKEQMNGVIAICNFGCAISLNLVINGQEYGNVWTDDRGNGNGIHPSFELGNKDRVTFLNWYELWLDNSLKEIRNKISTLNLISINDIYKDNKEPWWKFW